MVEKNKQEEEEFARQKALQKDLDALRKKEREEFDALKKKEREESIAAGFEKIREAHAFKAKEVQRILENVEQKENQKKSQIANRRSEFEQRRQINREKVFILKSVLYCVLF